MVLQVGLWDVEFMVWGLPAVAEKAALHPLGVDRPHVDPLPY